MGLDAKQGNRRFWCGFVQPLKMLIKLPQFGEKKTEGVGPGER